MDHHKIQTIQNLVDNQKFRAKIRQLKPGEDIPENIIIEFMGYSVEDIKIAWDIVLSLENDQQLSKNKNRIWSNIVMAADVFDLKHGNSDYQVKHSIKKRTSRWMIMKYAAIFVGILIAVFWVILPSETKLPAEIHKQVVVKSNPSGQKSRIHLASGSIVHLNADSELRYIEGFSENARTIHLKGEAYFEVAKDKSRPFTVISNNISVTALGTEFNVNAFGEGIQVALLEGSVVVSNKDNGDEIKLNPMEVVQFDSHSNKFKRLKANANDLVLWRNRVIYFDDTPVDEAMKTLSRWYAVDIEVKHAPAKKLTCSGKFHNKSLELLLKNLGNTLGFEYEIKGKKVTINFKN